MQVHSRYVLRILVNILYLSLKLFMDICKTELYLCVTEINGTICFLCYIVVLVKDLITQRN